MVALLTSHASIAMAPEANAARPRKRLGKKEKLKLRIEEEGEGSAVGGEELVALSQRLRDKNGKSNWSWMPLVDAHSSTCPILFSKDSK